MLMTKCFLKGGLSWMARDGATETGDGAGMVGSI